MSKSSGYSGWIPTEDGREVNSRTETKENSSTTEHNLWNNQGNSEGRSNHDHVVVNRDPEGKITSAHSACQKNDRPQSNESSNDSNSGSGK